MRLIRYYLTIWLPRFCDAWLAERKPEDDEQEWLQAGMEQAVDKYMTLLEEHNMGVDLLVWAKFITALPGIIFMAWLLWNLYGRS